MSIPRVNDWVGIPYGRLDCGHLALKVLGAYGIHVEDPGRSAVRSFLRGDGMVRYVPKDWPEVELDDLRPLDLLFMKPGKMEFHVCIVGEGGWALSTSKTTGSHLVPLQQVKPMVLSARRPA